MNDEVNQSQDRIWFVRKNGKVFGPLAAARIRNYVMEGRVELADEASKDRKNWRTLRSLPELIPLQMRNPEVMDEVNSLGDVASGKGSFWRSVSVVIVVLGAVIAAALFYQPPEQNQQPDCHAPAAAGINWNSCNKRNFLAENQKLDDISATNAIFENARFSGTSLQNGNFSYAHFKEADLTYVNFTAASLKGANLHGADLGNAILDAADLRYADFTGALLGGVSLKEARLEGAVWFNGKPCLKGSLGKCVQ